MTVLDVGKYITMMDNNKFMEHDNIYPFLLKLALPYIVEPLTYIYISISISISISIYIYI